MLLSQHLHRFFRYRVPLCSVAARCASDVGSNPLDHEYVLPERKENILRLLLNDPKKRNVLSLNMLDALKNKLISSSHDKELRVIILAAQPPIFSAGHDLQELTTKAGITYHAKVFARCSEIMCLLQDIQLPVIAEVKGHAAAAGCQLAASCDIVVAAHNAKFSTPGITVGLFCSTPGVALTRNVPRKVAMDMLLTGEPIDADAALRAGLVSRVVVENKVEEEAMKIAERLVGLSRPVLALGKSFIYSQLNVDRKTAYRMGEKMMIENLKLADCQEGIKAFGDKRKPKWTHGEKRVH